MAPTIDEEWNLLYTHNPKIQAFAVCKPSEILWITSNWDLAPDLENVMNAANNATPSVTVGGVVYNRVESSAEFYVASSDNNQGHLLMYLIELKTWAVAWAASDSIPELAITDLGISATKLKGNV
jgi:hypothetical protein